MNQVSIGQIALTKEGDTNNRAGLIGVVIRKYRNTFLGQSSVTVVWENDTYYDYSESDVGVEIDFMEVRTSSLDGADFTIDRTISDCIRSNLFKNLLTDVKEQLHAAKT